jgi:inward rectifier potassium channel
MHVVDESSPLAGETQKSLADSGGYLLLSISGTDETTGQTLMARYNYAASALRWNHGFVDILTTTDGVDYFDYTRFHEVEPL